MHTLTLATTLLFGAIRAVTPQAADGPWSKGWWLPRHEEKTALATNAPAKVVFLGDSITHGWETNCAEAYAELRRGVRRTAQTLFGSQHRLRRRPHGEPPLARDERRA